MQSLALGVAAFLVINNLMSPGMMIAATILLGKALSPVEMVIGVWRQWRGVVSAYDRLTGLLKANPPRVIGMQLPKPKGQLTLDNIYATPPGLKKPVLKGVNFDAYSGQVTALVGDNGAGKSTLIKCIAGIYNIDQGDYLFGGNRVEVHGPRDATSLGIEIVYQDLALCDNLDIVHNMFLGREKKKGMVLNEEEMESLARKTLDGLSVRTVKSIRQVVSSLSG